MSPVTLPSYPPGRIQRRGELEPTTAALVDMWRNASRRTSFHETLDSAFAAPRSGQSQGDQLVVGGGLHGAIYAATAEVRTGTAPLVAEARRTGGVYALSDSAVFYLNSRNRPGELGLPGTRGALNVVPNSILQPSDLDGRDYQTNAHLSFVVRAALAMYADVVKSSVTYIAANITEPRNRAYFARGSRGGAFRTDRIILATGLGTPSIADSPFADDVVMTFEDFVIRMGKANFPLAGWRRVAVLGAQDSGDAVVKFLLGQGPMPLGPASLDAVERIDWYGQACRTKEAFDVGARSCNAGIGRYLPRADDPDYPFVISAIPHKGDRVISDRRGGARIVYGPNKRLSDAYDHVVVCAGYEGSDIKIQTDVDKTLGPAQINTLPLREEIVYDDDGTALARRYVGTEIYKVGPCAKLPVTNAERQRAPALGRIPANSAAIFRYADRTRRLAEILNPA